MANSIIKQSGLSVREVGFHTGNELEAWLCLPEPPALAVGAVGTVHAPIGSPVCTRLCTVERSTLA